MFADLHNHNHSRSYFWLYPERNSKRIKGRYHPWTAVISNKKARENGTMGATYSQSDLPRLVKGNVKLTFNALYPIEKGFFSNSIIDAGGNLDLHPVRALFRHLHPLRVVAQSKGYMDIPVKMAVHFGSQKYKYWSFLNKEYDFIKSKSGVKMKSSLHLPGGFGLFKPFQRRKVRRRQRKIEIENNEQIEGKYFIPKDNAQISDSLSQDQITMVLTIEGAHALGTDSGHVNDWLANVDFIKNHWEHPIFFLTFAHHFYNKLCGHAHSMPSIGNNVFNQKYGMDKGFTSEGLQVIRKLLSIDTNNQLVASEKYRILIDVKHMNATSRAEFYKKIVEPCIGTASQFPVIASHVGYSGRKLLTEHIANYDNEETDYFLPPGENNYAWNINVCDEDIEVIVKTGGLIGISMDQRILGVPKKKKNKKGINNINAIYNSIYQIVEAANESTNLTPEQKSTAWNCLSFGSDFEGLIDPVNAYSTAMSYQQLHDDLIEHLNIKLKDGTNLYGLNTKEDIEQVVHKIGYKNAADFVTKYYPL